MFVAKNIMAALDPQEKCNERGGRTNVKHSKKSAVYFIEWIPNNAKTAVCDIASKNIKMYATFIGNITAIQQLFERISNHFQFSVGEEMSELEFTEAQNNMTN
ncbi:hypothetical protein GJ496_004111 [Pomphorhynchus laevis]|nr:hypothetical protein GJ496_004111 [Pomphorhynchus laevis]